MQNIFYISLASFVLLLTIVFAYFFFGKLTSRDRKAILETYQTINHDGRERKYRYFSPDENKKLPLVVMIHGYKFDSGKRMEIYSGMSNLAKSTKEFTVVYPEGIDKSWNGEFCCGTAFGKKIDDAGFVNKLVDKLVSEKNIDKDKIYIVGFSNGGFLVQKLLAENPDKYAAGGIIMSSIGELGGGQIDISKAQAPVMIVNGKRDSYTNHKLERKGFRFRTHKETVNKWSNQLNGELDTSQNEQFEQKTYVNSDGKTVVIARLYDTKHSWPDWRLWNFEKEIPSFTKDIWRFFVSSGSKL